MATTALLIRPIENLKQSFAALESAVLFCLADPKKRAVHALRTSIRRAEAQLALLALLPRLPEHQDQARQSRRLLKKLRRAAGKVRDMDVQRDLIDGEAEKLPDSDSAQNESRQLRRLLKHRRKNEAKRLLRKLHKQRRRLPVLLDELIQALKSVESLSLHQTKLVTLIRRFSATGAPDLKDIDGMHRLRKRAKLARYLAEATPPPAHTAHRLAAQFEELQQAGGTWHDWLLLSAIAEKELGRSAVLPQQFRNNTDRTLKTFQRKIRTMTP